MKLTKRIVALMLSVLLVFGTFVAASAASVTTEETESASTETNNNTAETATAVEDITVGAKGTLYSANDVDYYSFEVKTAGMYKINFSHSGSTSDTSNYFTVTLKNGSKKDLTSFTCKGSPATANSSDITLAAGTYFVEVKAGVSSANFTYTFKLVTVTSKYQVEDESEVRNDNIATATTLTVNSTNTVGKNLIYGNIEKSGDVDYYKFKAPKGYVSLTLKNGKEVSGSDNGNFYFDVIDYTAETAAKQLKITTISLTADEDKKVSPDIGVREDYYYIKVYSKNGATGSYGIEVYGQADKKSEAEYNNAKSYANALAANDYIYASTSSTDDIDFFKVTVTEKSTWKIEVKNAFTSNKSGSWSITIYDKDMKEVDKSAGTATATTAYTYSMKDLKAGAYYIVVKAGSEYTGALYKISTTKVSEEEKGTGGNNFWERISNAIKALDWKTWWESNFEFLGEIDWLTTISALLSTSIGTLINYFIKNS